MSDIACDGESAIYGGLLVACYGTNSWYVL